MPILQIRDESGKFIPIKAIRGDAGKSAYEQAVEGGYTGTEEAFIAMLNGLTASMDAQHYADFNNPHKVNKEQVGLGNVDNTSDADKPVSTAQETEINAVLNNLNDHIAATNPHGVTANQIGADPKPVFTKHQMLASGWGNPDTKMYSFENLFDSGNYDIEIYLDGDSVTGEQKAAFDNAEIVGVTYANFIKAIGVVPTVDIPIVIKAVKRNIDNGSNWMGGLEGEE